MKKRKDEVTLPYEKAENIYKVMVEAVTVGYILVEAKSENEALLISHDAMENFIFELKDLNGNTVTRVDDEIVLGDDYYIGQCDRYWLLNDPAVRQLDLIEDGVFLDTYTGEVMDPETIVYLEQGVKHVSNNCLPKQYIDKCTPEIEVDLIMDKHKNQNRF